jgi:DNA-binding beta-propeller fold protein YncE
MGEPTAGRGPTSEEDAMSKVFTLTFALPVLLLAGTANAQTPAALELTSRIPLANVNGRMDHMSVDLKGQRLFAAAFDNHSLEVIDLQAGRQVHTIRDGNPQASYYDPATNRLFVASGGDGTVKIFDGGTFALWRTVQLSADADNVRYDARNNKVIVGYGATLLVSTAAAERRGAKA